MREGEVIAGKYRVERALGQGGMGKVFSAHHLQLDEKVALKFLLPEALENPEAAVRFLREARAAVRIKSEHVARVIDVGALDNGEPFMVLEYLEGGDLEGWLKERGPLPVDQAVDFVLQACEAIAEAHALGIVHRDLKPANLFCVRRADGRLSIKVLDFGISKVTAPGAHTFEMTRTSAVVGSPLYMAPEQMRASKSVDVRADVWSLGVILYELVSDRTPFPAESVTELAVKVALEPPRPLEMPDKRAGAIEAVILRCLEKNRENRFPNVGELARALEPFGSPRAHASVERVLDTLRAAGVATAAATAPASLRPPPPGRSTAAAFAATSPSHGATLPNTSASWGQTEDDSPPARPSRRIAVVIAASGALVLGFVATLLAVLPRHAPSRSATASAPTEPPTPPSPSSVASAPPPGLSSSSSGETSLPDASAPPSASAPAPARPSRGTHRAAPDCDPPFTINAKGSRVFKKECL